MEHLVANLIGPADVSAPTVFDDQYISPAASSTS